MAWESWFVFDLGNVLIRIAYERVVSAICAHAEVSRDALIEILEAPGGYRDLELGAVNFESFHAFLCESAGFSSDVDRLREIWSDFFDGPVDGIDELLLRVRARYRVAFLSNSNEIHAQVIPRKFPFLFRADDRFMFSHRLGVAKPDPTIFMRALQILGTSAPFMLYTDDLPENVEAARSLGIRAFHFTGARNLERELEAEGLL